MVIMIGLRQVYSEKEQVGKKKYKMYSQEKRNTSNRNVTAKCWKRDWNC